MTNGACDDMNPLSRKVNEVMRGAAGSPLSPLNVLLLLASQPYGVCVWMRRCLYDWGVFPVNRLPCKVISVGNLTVGGTGKTPLSVYVANTVHRMGYAVAVVSRGYKSRFEKTGGVVSDGQKLYMDAADAGDEPYLMAVALDRIPVLIGKNRYLAGQRAMAEFGAEVLVLDDAYQHLALYRDINLLLLDNTQPFGNGYLVPRGALREPISGLCRADAVIFTRANPSGVSPVASFKNLTVRQPVFTSFHAPYLYNATNTAGRTHSLSIENRRFVDPVFLQNRNAFAFSGIAVNRDFRDTVRSFGCRLTDHLEFPDHHMYTDADLQRILNLSRKVGADVLVTTEKDYVRIAHRFSPGDTELVVVGIETAFGADTDAFTEYLRTRLETI